MFVFPKETHKSKLQVKNYRQTKTKHMNETQEMWSEPCE